MSHVCDICGHGYQYGRNLKRHIHEKHLQTEHWQCEIEDCNKPFQKRSFICEHLCNIPKLSRECAMKISITTERVISNRHSAYQSDVSEDDTVLDLLEEEEHASANLVWKFLWIWGIAQFPRRPRLLHQHLTWTLLTQPLVK